MGGWMIVLSFHEGQARFSSGREGGREGGRQAGRQAGREGGREGGREEGRVGGWVGGWVIVLSFHEGQARFSSLKL